MMKRRIYLMLLVGMLMVCAATAQEKKGYWYLAVKKTFTEGERSNGNETGLLNARDGLAEFQILHYRPATFKPDGTFSVDHQEDVTVVNMGGESTKEQRFLHTLSVEWSQPPQYVKMGEEGQLYIDFTATLDGSPYSLELLQKDRYGGANESYSIEFGGGVMPAVTIGKTVIGFSVLQQVLNQSDKGEEVQENLLRVIEQAGGDEDMYEEALEKAVEEGQSATELGCSFKDKASGRLEDDEPQPQNLKLGKESYLMLSVTTTYKSNTVFKNNNYTVTQLYLYKYGGDDVDVTTRADDKEQWKPTQETDSISQGGGEGGESKGTDLPPWVIPVAIGTIGVGAVGGFTLLRNLRKKDEEPDPSAAPSNQQPGPPSPPTMATPPPPPSSVVPPPPPVTPPPPVDTPPPPLSKPQKEGKENKKDKEERKDSTYKMILYKEFGSSLMVGDEPKLVGARIEEITSQGEKIERPDLTAQIEIAEGENITIVETGRADKYRAARICVTEYPKKEPLEGDVWFIFRAPGGALRNRVVFNIEDGEVRFKQDNLTLPARYEKEVRLPFVVVGINDGTADIKATILDEHQKETKDYSIKTEWNEEHQCYYAIIKDQITDPKADEGIAGNYLGYTIKIEAQKKDNPKRVIKGSLPINRYYMGLVMRMNGNVHCFHEEYKPGYHDPELKVRKSDGKDYAPAQQDCYLKLYDYNEEEHKLYVIDPKPLSVKWTVKDIAKRGGAQKVMMDLLGNEDTQKGLNLTLATSGVGSSIGTLVSNAHQYAYQDYKLEQQRQLHFQELLNGLGLHFKAQWQKGGEGKIYYILRCEKGVLIAPNRFDAEMEVTAEHENKTYTFKRTVHILSQPKRTYDSMEAVVAAPKEDEKIEQGLHEIEGGLMAAGLTKQMAPLLYFIRLQLDFYDVEYGYDARNIKKIQDCYLHALQRQNEEIKEKVAAMDAVDNLEKFSLDWWLEISYEGHDLLENMNWAERIGFAIASFGYSELVFNIPYEMKKCIVESKENKTALDAFTVGAWEAGKAYLIEQGIGAAIGGFKVGARMLAKGAKTAGKGLAQAATVASKETLKAGGKVAKEALQKSVKEMGETMVAEVSTGLKTWFKKQVSWELGAAEKAIISKTKSWLSGVKKAADGSKYLAAEEFALRQAVENIENLQTMIEMCRTNPTAENLLLRNQLILRCQADKQTMMLLKTPKLLVNEPLLQGLSLRPLKREFNALLQKIYSETDDLVKEELVRATKGKVTFSQIQVLNATSSKAGLLKEGLEITFDRDITYYWIDAQNKVHYFNQTYVESLYAKHFRQVVNKKILPKNTLGFDPRSLTPEAIKQLESQEAKQAAIAAKLYDQTVIEDVFGHFESYGDDLMRMVDPELHADALRNPAKVADAIFHKGAERFDYADDLWRQAEALSGWEREFLQGRSVSEKMEGFRQLKKVFDLLKDRDAQRHLFTKIPNNVKEAVRTIEHLDGVTVKLSQVEAKLAEQGFTFKGLAKEISELVYVIG
ncbi:MAG: hypothetical protein J5616_01895 [Bacteroidaceae bacterium]|nr:hypothetical protein [Bacteroidaceae bacterium]